MWGGGQSSKKNLLHGTLEARYDTALYTIIHPWEFVYIHKTTYGPLIHTALYVILLMWANLLLGQVGEVWVLEISTFLGPKWHSPDSSIPFHRAQKSLISRAQPPPTCPRNGFVCIKSITVHPGRINHRSINSHNQTELFSFHEEPAVV